MADALTVVVEDDDQGTQYDPTTNSTSTRLPDGHVVVQFGVRPSEDDEPQDFYRNLAEEISASELGQIAEQLIQGIEEDDRSRSQYLATRSKGLKLLGIKLEEPKSDVSSSGAAVEGQSVVVNPLLLEAILKGWANARGELLPAEGPVKVRINGPEGQPLDELAERLENDLNHYLTVTATEYYPDTSHMLLWGTYFGGSGFKKVYRCPLKRRPVSESVDCQDLIVSDATKDFRSCGRITHVITMRPSVMKRMKLIGAYRDVDLGQPRAMPNQVAATIGIIQGVSAEARRPEDQPHTIWETQCELDLDEYAPDGFKGKGIPIPYRVTIDKDSRNILALRRDWREDDEDAQRIQLYVKFPYVPGPGFYGTGLLQILGNSSAAMTAAWRESLDAGMYASFPGGLIATDATRQNTMNFRVSPGEFATVRTGGLPIDKMVMPLPYRDVTGGLMAMMDKIEQQSARLGGAVEIATQEGLANVPVGTMIAQIEQATKVMAAAHRDMHQAQAEEIKLLVELFRDHPDDFWRGSKDNVWNAQLFEAAIQTYQLVPRSDPNTPSHIHRTMKAVAYVQMMQDPNINPYLDKKQVVTRIVRALRDDPNGIVIDPPPQPQGQDPTLAKAMIDAQVKREANQIALAKLQQGQQQTVQQGQQKMAELQMQHDIEQTRLSKEMIIHRSDQMKMGHDLAMDSRKQNLEESRHALEQQKVAQEAEATRQQQAIDAYTAMKPEPPAKKGT